MAIARPAGFQLGLARRALLLGSIADVMWLMVSAC